MHNFLLIFYDDLSVAFIIVVKRQVIFWYFFGKNSRIFIVL